MLLELQSQWQRSLLHPDSDLSYLESCRGGVRSTAQAFAVYVNNVRANVFNALLQTFPATFVLAGETAMQRATLSMLQHSPPTSGDMGVYGGVLVEEIVNHVDSNKVTLIGEVARYEWLLDQLRRVSREPTWSIHAAAALPPEQWASLRLRLAKQAMLFESPVAVRAQCDAVLMNTLLTHDQSIKPTRLLMVANDDDVVITELELADGIWLSVLDEGNVEYATERAMAMNSAFDLQSLLAKLFSLGALAIPEESESNDVIGAAT